MPCNNTRIVHRHEERQSCSMTHVSHCSSPHLTDRAMPSDWTWECKLEKHQCQHWSLAWRSFANCSLSYSYLAANSAWLFQFIYAPQSSSRRTVDIMHGTRQPSMPAAEMHDITMADWHPVCPVRHDQTREAVPYLALADDLAYTRYEDAIKS